jgi:hypothetical protein
MLKAQLKSSPYKRWNRSLGIHGIVRDEEIQNHLSEIDRQGKSDWHWMEHGDVHGRSDSGDDVRANNERASTHHTSRQKFVRNSFPSLFTLFLAYTSHATFHTEH